MDSQSHNRLLVTGEDLTPAKLYRCIKSGQKIELDDKIIERIKLSNEIVKDKISKGELIYGVNTKVGALLKESRAKESEIAMIKDHAISEGEKEEKEIARATLLVMINQLASGRSTISLKTFNFLVEVFNKGLYPIFSKEGSLGASGDLIPLANLVHSLLEGEVEYQGKVVSSKEMLGEVNLEQGDAIALINSTAHSCASLVFSLEELSRLFDLACASAAFSMEVLRSSTSHLEIQALNVKKHVDQIMVGDYILNLLEDSKLVNTSQEMQEAYSLRCIPQVYGSVRHVIDLASYVLIREMNSFSGNPVVVLEKREIAYAGNFHAEILAFFADLLRIAISSLASMIERRINRILNPALNRGLPAFLARENSSGLMMLQYLAAYYVNELRILATPSSASSISVSADQEDFVSMAGNAVNLLRRSISCFKEVLALELLCCYEASKFLNYEEKGGKLKFLYERLKDLVENENELKKKIEKIKLSLIDMADELRRRFGSLFTE